MFCDQEQVVPNESEPGKAIDEKQQSKSVKRAYEDNDASPEIEPQKKLCLYYYLDTCMRNDECSFMHSEFPCKFYYFGYECKDGLTCKLMHGSALDTEMKQALWQHVMSAPANLLQRFPCFPNVLLRKNFEDRHNELIQMEQEGLLGDNNKPCNSISTLNEDNKTMSTGVEIGDVHTELGKFDTFLKPEQIESLLRRGVDTMDKLLEMDASALLQIGFDSETLSKMADIKEVRLKKSIYAAFGEQSPKQQDNFDENNEYFTVPVDEHILTDEELLSILNEDLSSSAVAINVQAKDIGSSVPYSRSIDCFERQFKQHVLSTGRDDRNNKCVLKAIRSEFLRECSNIMLFPSTEGKENDNSIHRTVDQFKKIDSLLLGEQRQDSTLEGDESDVSLDPQLTDSNNQSFGSDSDGQSCLRMPFKSIINRYTPAMEINATNGKFPTKQYKLIPVDVPSPNFDRIRRSFISAPTYSLDPRIQIMFNVGPHKVSNRDPRLKKLTEMHIGDAPKDRA